MGWVFILAAVFFGSAARTHGRRRYRRGYHCRRRLRHVAGINLANAIPQVPHLQGYRPPFRSYVYLGPQAVPNLRRHRAAPPIQHHHILPRQPDPWRGPCQQSPSSPHQAPALILSRICMIRTASK